jgi:hypothetical protein
MHDSLSVFACAAVPGCVIVAGGLGRTSAEVLRRASPSERFLKPAPPPDASKEKKEVRCPGVFALTGVGALGSHDLKLLFVERGRGLARGRCGGLRVTL